MEIKILNYKTIKDQKINIQENKINYILGSNESGKSNLLNSIRAIGLEDSLNRIKINSESDLTRYVDGSEYEKEIKFVFEKNGINNIINGSDLSEQVFISKSLNHYKNIYLPFIEKNKSFIDEIMNKLNEKIANIVSNTKEKQNFKKISEVVKKIKNEELLFKKDIDFIFNKNKIDFLNNLLINNKFWSDLKKIFDKMKIERPRIIYIEPIVNAFSKEENLIPWSDLKNKNSLIWKILTGFAKKETFNALEKLYELEGVEDSRKVERKEQIIAKLNENIKSYFEELKMLKANPRFYPYNSNNRNMIGLRIEVSKKLKYKIDTTEENNRSLGFKTFVRTLFYLKMLSKQNIYSYFIIDEPEQGLHPLWQELLIDEINKILKIENNKITIIITTHSPYILKDISTLEEYEKNIHFLVRAKNDNFDNSIISGETLIKNISDKQFYKEMINKWGETFDRGIWDEEAYIYKMILDSSVLKKFNTIIKKKEREIRKSLHNKVIKKEEYDKKLMSLRKYKINWDN